VQKIKRLLYFILVKHFKKTTFLLSLVLLGYWLILPNRLFNTPTSVVLTTQEGYLLGAKIAKDGQWRFPYSDTVPQKFEKAILEYEDRRFYDHIGIDAHGIGRAVKDNWQAGKIRSGASTLTMQVMRLANQRKGRSLVSKLKEMTQATRLELEFSKKDILALYASHAPFGGNVVGLDAAAWRYYGKSPHLLSWGEATTLAVLPNSPGLIHLGKNRKRLKEKRDLLLQTMLKRGFLDSMTADLAQLEPIPAQPLPLPRLAPHLLERVARENKKRTKHAYFKTTLHFELQQQVNRLVQQYGQQLTQNNIHNIAILVTETKTGKVLAYVGNTPPETAQKVTHGRAIDMVTANRSTGSILKPFLYASMLQEGLISPNSLVSDIPLYMGSYRPLNFYEQYDGAISAKKALARSLNIPFVQLLKQYGTAKFCKQLQQLGLTSITQKPSHYGLSLILGGAEANLWDLTGAYASMGRTLLNFNDRKKANQLGYDLQDFHPLHYISPTPALISSTNNPPLLKEAPVLSAFSIYQTLEAMKEVVRPSSEGNWKYFESSQEIAWKTGTSFGFRDAWAIGLTPEYTIGVWVGNATGEGRANLVGVKAAAPLLFDAFRLLPNTSWFIPPIEDTHPIVQCQQSGFIASPYCTIKDTVLISKAHNLSTICPYHQPVYLDSTEQWQVHGKCNSVHTMVVKNWFVLPPLQEYYYAKKHPEYQKPPPYRLDCSLESEEKMMQFVYPKNTTKIYLTKNYAGQLQGTIFKLAHKKKKHTVFWHLDQEYIGSTQDFHELELRPNLGKHTLTVVDEQGHQLEVAFTILSE
jgi:penicillin-binding protein 1C